MKIKPTYERLLIEESAPEAKTKSGLIIPEDSREVPTIGTVIDFGEKVKDYISYIKQGDRIMFLKYAGLKVNIDGKDYKLIMANDVIGIITD